MIRVFRPSYDGREEEAVCDVLRSGWVGLGPKVEEFERRFAAYCGIRHCIGTSSGTSALCMAVRLLRIGAGDEVIVPAMTFVSTAHAVVLAGARPVFADVLPDTLNIDPDDAARRIGPRTRAIIPVHYGGRPADIDRLLEAADDIPLVEDCAHAAGARHAGRHVGGFGAAGCFSFHAVKNLAMGEGGAILVDDGGLAERAAKMRWLGIDRSTWDRTGLDREYWWEYTVDEVGMKCHLDDIHAAIGLVQLQKLEEANRRRAKIAELYRTGLDDVEEVRVPPGVVEGDMSSWHMFVIRAKTRDDLNVYLAERGIQTGVHYKPIHLYPCYGQQQRLPVAEKAFESILTLPMYPDLTDGEVRTVIDTIRSFYRRR